ncbi:hypothetical protein MMC27_007713 [Xylographa pallens]|nr:hypothetical protein [Xylographa pallens]
MQLLKSLAEWFPKSGRAVVNAILRIAQTRQNQPPKESIHQRNYVVPQDVDAFIKSLPIDPKTLRPTVQFPEGNFAKPRAQGRGIPPPTNPPGDHEVTIGPQEEDNIDPRLRGDVVVRREASGSGQGGRKDSELLARPETLEQDESRGSSGRRTSGEAFAQKRDGLLEEFVRLVQKQTEVEQISKEQAKRLVHRAHLIQQQGREFNEDIGMVISQRQGQRQSSCHSSIPVRSVEPSVRSATEARNSLKAIETPSNAAKKRPLSEVGEPDRYGSTLPLIEEANIPAASVQSRGFVHPLKGLPKGGWDQRNPRADKYDFNSCAIDCIATLFKLLKVCEKAKDGESKLTSSLAVALFTLVDQDWNIPDHELNKAKMPFYNEAIELYGDESGRRSQRYLQHLGVADILTGLHGDLVNIVGFETDRRAICTKCKFLSGPHMRYFTCIRCPDSNAEEGLIMGTVRAFFANNKYSEEKNYCAKEHLCDCYVHIVKDLPELLFVLLDGRRVEHDSTPRRHEVRFRTFEGSVTGTYGWLGSICYREEDQHYKLFWASENPEELLSYDHHDGSGINRYRHGRNIEDAIPEEWWTRGELVVLQRSDIQSQTHTRRLQAQPDVMPSSGATGAVDVEMEDPHDDGGWNKSDTSDSPPPPSPPVPRDSPRRYKGTSYIIKKVSKPGPSPAISQSHPSPSAVTQTDPFGRTNSSRQEIMAGLMTESERRNSFRRAGLLEDPQDEPLLLEHNLDLWNVTDTIPNQIPGLPTRQGHQASELPSRAAALQHPEVLQRLDNVWEWESE